MKWRFYLMIFSLALTMFGFTAVEAQTGGCSTTHVVQGGDNLSRIAARYRTTTADLQARNGISNPDRIYAGQRLCVTGGFVPPIHNTPPGFARVTTHTLNIRTGPGLEFNVIAKARNGDIFRVNGRTWDGNWYLVTLDALSGRQAWAFARLMHSANPQSIPVILEASAPPQPSLVILAEDAMTYSGPPTLITVAPYEIAAGMSVEVIGRNEAADWFQVRTDTGTAWLPLDAFPAGFARYDFPVTG